MVFAIKRVYVSKDRADQERVTLLHGAKDEHVNHAAVLLDWLADHGAAVVPQG